MRQKVLMICLVEQFSPATGHQPNCYWCMLRHLLIYTPVTMFVSTNCNCRPSTFDKCGFWKAWHSPSVPFHDVSCWAVFSRNRTSTKLLLVLVAPPTDIHTSHNTTIQSQRWCTCQHQL